MRVRSALPLFALASLAACGQETESYPNSPNASQSAANADTETEDEADLSVIPDRFHGVWDNLAGTCARESDLRIEITSDKVLFYESIGSVLEVQRAREAFIVKLAMEGEGEQWEESFRMALDPEKDHLHFALDVQVSPGVLLNEMPAPIIRKRCPQ